MSSANPIVSAVAKFWSAARPDPRKFLGLVLAAWLFPFAVPALELDEEARSRIGHIENYLNGLTTVEARFVQIASTGEFAEGTLYISRPGKIRIEYDEPNPNLIVSDGLWLAHHDKELKQTTHVLLNTTPASILLDKRLSLTSDDLAITDFQQEPGLLQVSLVRTKDPAEGTITLMFSEKPLALRRWSVRDAQGVITTVSLQNPRFGHDLDRRLFHLVFEKQPTPGQ